MGNCLNNSEKVVTQNEQENPQKEMEDAEKIGSSDRKARNIEPKLRSQDSKKKRVIFKLEEENVKQKLAVKFETPEENSGNEANSEAERSDAGGEMDEVKCRPKNGGGERAGGMVRVRVVLTKKELKKILSGEEFGYSNVEELIAGFKLRGRRVSEVRSSRTGRINGGWRPALDNIPEERS